MKRAILLLVPSVLLLSATAPPARAAQNGQFVLRCSYSHTLPDDPIVFPGQPGASHLHDFFGNTTADAGSTFESMLSGETTCRVPSDTAGYWTPTALLDGTRVQPRVMRIYYLGPNTGTVETIPPDLQMVGGNRDATSPADNPHVSWNCGQTKAVKTPQEDTPYDCTPWASYAFVDGIIAVIDFPNCWNGTGLRLEDVVYPISGRCPLAFRHVLPKLSERVHFGVMNPLAPDGSLAMTLSSGPWYTLHADFWNTWQQDRLDQLVLDCLVGYVHCGSVDATASIRWSRQFGTTRYDLAYAAAPDGEGGSYVAGFTNFALDGQTYHHRYDAFLSRFNAGGRILWTRQFGTNGTDQALAVAVSGRDVYVAGSTDGRFPKHKGQGARDAFVARFRANGALRWLDQFGTHRDDQAMAIAVARDGIFIAGVTRGHLLPGKLEGPSDAFLTSMDPKGNERWTRQFGGRGDDRALAIGVRAERVYVAGWTEGLRRSVADLDGFVAAFARSGAPAWRYQFGAMDDDGFTGLAARANGVYLAGWTTGRFRSTPSAGGLDAVIAKVDVDGRFQWFRQFGGPSDDDAIALAAAGKGVYVTGSTTGEIPDGTALGETDGFLRKYLPNGTEIWTMQFGTDDYDRVYAMAADLKAVVVAGTTHGTFEGQTNAGDRDVFAVRIAFT